MSVPLPPVWARRLLLAPLVWLLGAWLLVAVVPAIILVAALISFALPGRMRLLRLTGFAFVYLAVEVVGLTVCLLTWLASGFGYALRRPGFVTAHYAILAKGLSVLFWFGTRYFELTIRGEGPELPGDDGDPTTTEHPLLVMSRHAGPGDSFLLVQELLSWVGRRPRIVLKSTLQWDPLIDVLLNRLPMSFIDPTADKQDGPLAAITRLAATMEARDALLIFPEGGNVTPGRRRRAIDRLRASGRHDAARRAERIVHLMPPRPGGVQAALRANPDLHVVVVAHSGLDDLDSLADIWRELPVSKTLHLRWHSVPSAEVPTDTVGLSDWLFTEWELMDRWVAAHRAAEDSPDAVSPGTGATDAPGRAGHAGQAGHAPDPA
jgi:1-acyl-sn-glycerol-3-phosphate acyltransferase